MGTSKAERVVCFREVSTKGFGDESGTGIDQRHGSCVPKPNSYVVHVLYFK